MRDSTAVFIDGPNLWAMSKALQFSTNFKALRDLLAQRYASLKRIYYVSAVTADTDGVSSLRPLIDWLDYNGYTSITKAGKLVTNADGTSRIKGNMDVDLAVTAMEVADHVGRIVLFTGDGDFVPLIRALQRKGVTVEVWSSLSSRLVADEIRRACDVYVDMDDRIIELIEQRRDRGVAAAE